MEKFIFITLILLQIGISSAQQGPIIECHNCDGLSGRPLPVQGNWYNPQQSGSGYLLDVQNGYLSGFYFGYTAEGEPTWLSFNGPLQPSEDVNVNWFVELPLTKISGGNAFNQPHQFPTSIEETGDVIRLDFHFAHYASVKINAGETQRIIPINYGVAEEQEFEESEYQFPELEGMWTFVFKFSESTIEEPWGYYGSDFYIRKKSGSIQLDGSYLMYYRFTDYMFPEAVNFASISCRNFTEILSQEGQMTCELSNFPDVFDRMPVAPGNIGPNHIYAENENGDVFEAFRVNYKSYLH